ncbi:unnamed protein product [Urochloa humidicola]
MDLVLPFKIGGLAEYKAFLTGYGGAWFCCEIHNMHVNKSAGFRAEELLLLTKHPLCDISLIFRAAETTDEDFLWNMGVREGDRGL